MTRARPRSISICNKTVRAHIFRVHAKIRTMLRCVADRRMQISSDSLVPPEE